MTSNQDEGRSEQEWLISLNRSIILFPDAPANYVLRGEYYCSVRDYERAWHDFWRAYDLASEQVRRADWGIVAQVTQDRALYGLQEAEKHLQRRQPQLHATPVEEED